MRCEVMETSVIITHFYLALSKHGNISIGKACTQALILCCPDGSE